MVLTVDSSVWIGYLQGRRTPATDALDAALAHSLSTDMVLLDVVLMEVLRGCRSLRDLRAVESALNALPVETAGGEAVARSAANIYRHLRRRGITVRSSIDLLVGAWCIEHDALLLHDDRDYAGMMAHHGLRSWLEAGDIAH